MAKPFITRKARWKDFSTSWCQNGGTKGGGVPPPPGIETEMNDGCGGLLRAPGVETGMNEGCRGFSPPSGIETGMNEGCGGVLPSSGIETGTNKGERFPHLQALKQGRTRCVERFSHPSS